MIGKIIIGKSFRGCISYCLDKQQSEVLDHNLCYGDKKDLIRQFNEVRNLNPKLQKPVQHITLSFPKGEQLSEFRLREIAAESARDLGFEKNQYIVVHHSDTGHQHIHIVVNRVGFDGKTVKDNHNYRKIAEFCRKMELKFKLQKVLSPRRYLPLEQRNLPRLDHRKEQLKTDIQESLSIAENYHHFADLMKSKGYQIEKARGIAFIDARKVRTKGSDVGYSLSRFEKILSIPKGQRPSIINKEFSSHSKVQIARMKPAQSQHKDFSNKEQKQKKLSALLKPATNTQNSVPEMLPKKRWKKKRLHL